MRFPVNVLANADDFGYSNSVNKAISFCFENGYINSATLLTNTAAFEEAVYMIKDNSSICNIGVHINLAEGIPLTNVSPVFLKPDGSWDLQKTGNPLNWLGNAEKKALQKEIYAQVEKARAHGVQLNHMDSHYHLHALPGMFNLFLNVATHFNLKMRLAQTYREGNYLKFWYRQFINSRLTRRGLNYTDRFENVNQFLSAGQFDKGADKIEIMLHPDFDINGTLTDHFDARGMAKWVDYLMQPPIN